MDRRMIDVREYPEFVAGHIAGSQLVPLGKLHHQCETWDRREELLLVCRSGLRAERAREMLAARGFHKLAVLEGGVDQWVLEGNVLTHLRRRPWSMERQVRVVAGALVLMTLALSFVVSRYFLAGTALIGAGLVFAGISDICMMASLLGKLPWNRQPS